MVLKQPITTKEVCKTSISTKELIKDMNNTMTTNEFKTHADATDNADNMDNAIVTKPIKGGSQKVAKTFSKIKDFVNMVIGVDKKAKKNKKS